MGVFSGIDKASATDKKPKMDKVGDYALSINAIRLVESHETSGLSYVIETTVLESDNPAIRPNEDRSITINRLDSKKAYNREKALGNLKCFVAAAFSDHLGVDLDPEAEKPSPDDTWEELSEQTVIDDGAGLRGVKFRVKISHMKTGDDKQYDFYKPAFYAYKNKAA